MGKKWTISLLIAIFAVLAALAGFVALVDPYFHFHGPIGSMGYILTDERYQNDGIVKHFDYDAVICGSSMTENFKTSDMDAIFGVTSVKVPFSGGSYKEVNDLLTVATEYNDKITTVVRCLDYNRLFNDKDHVDYDEYPTYLYDKNPFNDVKYLFNMTPLFMAVQNVLGFDADGKIVTDFDKYANWMPYYPCGKDVVNNYYQRDTLTYAGSQTKITQEDYDTIKANIQQNVIDLATKHPEIDFYLYFSPYNIYYMDYNYQNGDTERYLAAEKFVIEMLLPYENIHLYSFFTDYELIWSIENYRDVAHHSDAVNTQILYWLKEGKGLLTKENYEAYCKEEYDYYMNLDYDAMYAELSGRNDVILNH